MYRATLLLAMLPFTANATGRMTCESGDPAAWQPKEAVEEKLTAEGWSVRFIKEDGGCWEVYGTTPEGDRVEAYVDPLTTETLLIAQRGKILFRKE